MVEKDILISVVIPVYNAEKFIQKAIESVQNQTFSPYEIIVVDDGSTDSTYEFIKKNFPNIIILKQENQGVSSARNRGIKKAKGNWITFLDADDVWFPNILKNYRKVLINNEDLNWSCSPYSIVSKGKKKIIEYKGKQLQNNHIINLLLAYKDFNFRIISELVSTCSVIIKKEIFQEVGLFNEEFKRGEDIDLWFRIALKHPKIGYGNEVGFSYLMDVNENSITSTEQNFSNIKDQIFRINKTWAYAKLLTDFRKKEASFVLNIWCYRLLKSIIKRKYFHLINLLEYDVYSNLNVQNKFLIYITKKIA